MAPRTCPRLFTRADKRRIVCADGFSCVIFLAFRFSADKRGSFKQQPSCHSGNLPRQVCTFPVAGHVQITWNGRLGCFPVNAGRSSSNYSRLRSANSYRPLRNPIVPVRVHQAYDSGRLCAPPSFSLKMMVDFRHVCPNCSCVSLIFPYSGSPTTTADLVTERTAT